MTDRQQCFNAFSQKQKFECPHSNKSLEEIGDRSGPTPVDACPRHSARSTSELGLYSNVMLTVRSLIGASEPPALVPEASVTYEYSTKTQITLQQKSTTASRSSRHTAQSPNVTYAIRQSTSHGPYFVLIYVTKELARRIVNFFIFGSRVQDFRESFTFLRKCLANGSQMLVGALHR